MHNFNRDKSRSISFIYFLHLLIFPFMCALEKVATYAAHKVV